MPPSPSEQPPSLTAGAAPKRAAMQPDAGCAAAPHPPAAPAAQQASNAHGNPSPQAAHQPQATPNLQAAHPPQATPNPQAAATQPAPGTNTDGLTKQEAEAQQAAEAAARLAATAKAVNGLVLLYCGDGKGKTTAALGLVFRALGRSFEVAVVVFAQPTWQAGERLMAQALPQMSYLVAGECLRGSAAGLQPEERRRLAMGDAWLRARACIEAGSHRLVVLDDITAAIAQGDIAAEDVAQTLAQRPPHVHVVLTGRDAPPQLIAQADVITEMRRHKHVSSPEAALQVGLDF